MSLSMVAKLLALSSGSRKAVAACSYESSSAMMESLAKRGASAANIGANHCMPKASDCVVAGKELQQRRHDVHNWHVGNRR